MPKSDNRAKAEAEGFRFVDKNSKKMSVDLRRLMEEVLQDFIIAGIAQGYRIEIVAHHELVEDIGTEHHGLRNLHLGVVRYVYSP